SLYEADDRLGGHADTHQVTVDGQTLQIDTGFIVHNDRTYPTLIRLFDDLGVVTQESDMSMSVRCDRTDLQYAGAKGALGIFAQPKSLVRPQYLRMLAEIVKFHRMAKALLAEQSTGPDQTLEAFLDDGGFSEYFKTFFMTPVVAAVWSCDPASALHYPARYLLAFLNNHGMLNVTGSPTWRTVVGGSKQYVQKIAANIGDIRLSSPVASVLESAAGVQITTVDGHSDTYDCVVIATHPNQALKMLTDPSAVQQEVLSAMPYSSNTALLHTDTSILPTAKAARASWNYLRPDAAMPQGQVTVSYDMTRLQRLPVVGGRRFIVTLGGAQLVDPNTIIEQMHYEHPIYTPSSVAAQQRLPLINTDRIVFAGAYHGWGFHEDGALSGLRAAQRLGARWETNSPASAAELAA
ncbi:MAG: FAD-dependent oxidoreductase, partial [Antricoccus sp.]